MHSSTETRKIVNLSLKEMLMILKKKEKEGEDISIVNSQFIQLKIFTSIPHRVIRCLSNNRFHYLVNRIQNLNKLLLSTGNF